MVSWSKEEIVTQHAVVKNFLLNNEAREPEKLRDHGRINHKKACLPRTNMLLALGDRRVITTEGLNLQSSSFLSVLSLSLFSKNLSGQEEVGNVSLLLVDASS